MRCLNFSENGEIPAMHLLCTIVWTNTERIPKAYEVKPMTKDGSNKHVLRWLDQRSLY